MAQKKGLTPQQMLEFTKPGVVFVEHFYSGWVNYQGQKYGSARNPGEPFFESFFGVVKAGPYVEGGGASGFLVHPDGYILTAGHCVQDYIQEGMNLLIYAFVRDYKIPTFVQQVGRMPNQQEIDNLVSQVIREGATVSGLTKEIYVRTGNWSAYKAAVLVVSEFRTGKDVAIIKITGKNFPTIPIGNSDEVKEGDEIVVIGFPGIVQDMTQERSLSMVSLLIPTVTSGIVSAIKTDVSGSPVFQINAYTAGGNSGGPAINSKGEAIGICSFGPSVTHYAGDQYGFFIPINQAKIFINQAGFTPTSGLTDQVYKRALDYFWQKKYKEALKEFKTVLEFYPRHPSAERYILECNEKIVAGEGGGAGIPTWLLGLIVVAIVVVIIFILLRFMKRVPAVKPKAKLKKGIGYLYVQAGPLAGNKFDIQSEGIRLGRDPAKNQIVLTGETVSREHALVDVSADGKTVRIKNLSTTNPTYVNDRPVTETELRDGDRIKIGENILTYKSQ